MRCKGMLLALLLMIGLPVCAQSKANDAIEHLRAAHALLAANQTEAAIPELRAVLAVDASNVDALGNLGVLLFFRHQDAEAIIDLRRALQLQPELWKIQALLGMAEARTGQAADALHDLQMCMPHLPEKHLRVEVGMMLVEIHVHANDRDKAAAVLSELRAFEPENPQVLLALYRIHADMAREAVLSLALVAPQSAALYDAVAHDAARCGDTSQALIQAQHAALLDDHLPGVHDEIAELLHALPASDVRHAQAEPEYRRAIDLNPTDGKALMRLGELSAERGDLTAAMNYDQRALQLDPHDADASYAVAGILLAQNKLPQAATELERTVASDASFAVAHYRLATVYRKLGRTEDARREVEAYRHYKQLKESLRATFKTLHLGADRDDDAASSVPAP